MEVESSDRGEGEGVSTAGKAVAEVTFTADKDMAMVTSTADEAVAMVPPGAPTRKSRPRRTRAMTMADEV